MIDRTWYISRALPFRNTFGSNRTIFFAWGWFSVFRFPRRTRLSSVFFPLFCHHSGAAPEPSARESAATFPSQLWHYELAAPIGSKNYLLSLRWLFADRKRKSCRTEIRRVGVVPTSGSGEKSFASNLNPMISNYEMSSVCVDVGVMWRLSEDLNRRFAARVQHHHHPQHHVHTHRSTPMSMLYNGICTLFEFAGASTPTKMWNGQFKFQCMC